MSGSVPKLACRKRLRSCDGSNRNIQNDNVEEEETGKKMLNGDGKKSNTNPVFLQKEKKSLNSSSSEKTARTDDYQEGEGDKKNGKASAALVQKEKIKEKLNVSSKKNVQTEYNVKEEKIRNDNSKSKSRKFSMLYEREERRKRPHNGNCVKKIHGNGNEREQNYTWNYDSNVKDEEMTATSSWKEQKKNRPTNTNSKKKQLQNGVEEGEKQMRNLDCKMRNGESSAAYIKKVKEMKRPNSTNNENNVQRNDKKYGKNMQNGYYNVSSRKVSATSFQKEKEKKLPSSDIVLKKINSAGRNISCSKNNMQRSDGNKRTEPITSAVKEKEMRPYERTEMKVQCDGEQKKRNMSSDMSKERTTKQIYSNYKKRKREELSTLFNKGKSMQLDVNKKKIHSGKVKEKNWGDGKEKKRNTPFSFFKVICNNFKEYLSVPPTVATELEDLTNHHVYLKDSEGKSSKIRLSVVDGSLSFHQGWNVFVSDHLIKWGEFLLFEYTAKSTFSVRIFGRDSRERLHFNVVRKREGVKKKEIHTNRLHDDLISFDVKSEDRECGYYFSDELPRNREPGTHHVTVHTAEDPKRVERMVGSGPVPLDNRNGNEVILQCGTRGMSPLRSKQKGVILITDSESSTHENDIVKLITSTADSDTHHVAADTNEDPKRVQIGIENGQSAVVGVKMGRLTDVECRTKCTSLKCIQKKAPSSVQSGIENGLPAVVEVEMGILPDVECATKCASPKCSEKEALSVDEASLAYKNDDTPKDDFYLHDSDEDLRRKQEICSIILECTTAVNKYDNDGETKFNPDACRNYEAPGGFRCLEKWKNSIVRGQAVLDGTGLIKPESTQETDSKFVVEYGAVGLNPGDKCVLSKDTHACTQQIFTMPIKDPSHPDKVSPCEHDATESNHSIDGKGTCAFVELQPTVPIKNPSSPDRMSKCGYSSTKVKDDIDEKGTTAKLETKMGHLEPVGSIVGTQTTNIPVCANNADACQSELCFSKQEDTNSVDCSTPVKPNILESDDCSILKVNLQFYIPNTTREWLELPKSLPNAVRQRKQDRNVIMLKDPMKRLWPVLYHENSIFVGFTSGWKHFAAANDLQRGDLCELFKEPGNEETVYSIQITKK